MRLLLLLLLLSDMTLLFISRQGSIIAIIEVYVVPIDSLTDPEDQALYTQLENDTSLQLIDTSFRESLTNLSETGQVNLTVDTFNFSLPGMGHME